MGKHPGELVSSGLFFVYAMIVSWYIRGGMNFEKNKNLLKLRLLNFMAVIYERL